MNRENDGYRIALKDDESLAIFLRCLGDFDKRFCDLMAGGKDFTLKIEVHGNKGELIHCRVHSDSFERPPGVERRVEQKASR